MENISAAPAPASAKEAAIALDSLLKAYRATVPATDRSAATSSSSPLAGFVSGGADRASSSAAPAVDKTVALPSNDRFLDVIRDALGERPLATPQRIAVELQTPPGQTVTVFFSQSNGQLRAQLSASDAGSLHWLQQQVGGLRDAGTESGQNVLWLPPQLDQQPGQSDQGQGRQQPQHQAQRGAPTSEEDLALARTLFEGTETGMESTRS